MCGICLPDLVWNCGGRTAGRGHSTSGQCVVPLPVVVAVAVLVTAVLAVVPVPAFGGYGGGLNRGVSVCVGVVVGARRCRSSGVSGGFQDGYTEARIFTP
jgi:hypothetical protein